MKTLKTRIEKNAPWKSLVLFFLSTVLLQFHSVAQNVSNVKSTLASIKAEQENQAFQEKMSYLYMFLGLALVIAIAWFSTVYFARKSKKIAVETNHHRHYIKHSHDPRDPRRRHKMNRARR